MKQLSLFFALLLLFVCLKAQAQEDQSKQLFFAAGFVTPQFFGGSELLRANDLRQEGLSYYKPSEGTRASTGAYPANSGFSLSIGYHIPVRKVQGLRLGLLVNSGQTGSTPATAGYEEGYFFNFLNFGGSIQYMPVQRLPLYLRGEVGMGSVFTKNRFINSAGEQDFLHHFGIGLEGGAALGYIWSPFPANDLSFFVEGLYQFYQTRVEVSGIGDDTWQFGALHLSGGIQF
jgi:hypothetical protein